MYVLYGLPGPTEYQMRQRQRQPHMSQLAECGWMQLNPPPLSVSLFSPVCDFAQRTRAILYIKHGLVGRALFWGGGFFLVRHPTHRIPVPVSPGGGRTSTEAQKEGLHNSLLSKAENPGPRGLARTTYGMTTYVPRVGN